MQVKSSFQKYFRAKVRLIVKLMRNLILLKISIIIVCPKAWFYNIRMLTYGNPICFRTKSRGALFCSTKDCLLPAFGCSEHCLSGHSNHDFKEWSQIDEPIRIIVELQLTEGEEETLRRQ